MARVDFSNWCLWTNWQTVPARRVDTNMGGRGGCSVLGWHECGLSGEANERHAIRRRGLI